jgi:hypothetical protein
MRHVYAVLSVLLVVLGGTATAHAAASWVLWMQEAPTLVMLPGVPPIRVVPDWSPVKVFPTLPACQDGMVQTFAQAQALGKKEGTRVLIVEHRVYIGTPGTPEDRSYTFKCLPDTVQP